MIVADGLTEYRVRFAHTSDEKSKAQIRFHGTRVKNATTASIEKRWRRPWSDEGWSPWIFASTGVACCSFGDRFVKETGRKLALKRAMKDWLKSSRTLMWKAYHERPGGLHAADLTRALERCRGALDAPYA